MARTIRCIIALTMLVRLTPCCAQELTNHALGHEYVVTPEPAARYADDTGPQPFTQGAAYAGELTDGMTGPANYKSPEWVGWRDTSYADPVQRHRATSAH